MDQDDVDIDDPVVVGRFSSAAAAAIACHLLNDAGIVARVDGEAMASLFWHYGAAIGGVAILARREDAERAAEILAEISQSRQDWGADFATAAEQDGDQAADEISPELTRAFRASIMSLCFLPVLLNIYSLYLLIRHRLYRAPRNWRVSGAFIANFVVLSLAAWVVYLALAPRQPPEYILLNGKRYPVEYETRHETIPLVP